MTHGPPRRLQPSPERTTGTLTFSVVARILCGQREIWTLNIFELLLSLFPYLESHSYLRVSGDAGPVVTDLPAPALIAQTLRPFLRKPH